MESADNVAHIEIAVPGTWASIAAALRSLPVAQKVSVRLAPGFEEPREAWPLELEAPVHLEIVGPPERDAVLWNVNLGATDHVSVTLTGVNIRGHVSMAGCCVLQDCEVKQGMDISCSSGRGSTVKSCTVRDSQVGVTVRGAALLEDNVVESGAVAVCIQGNLDVVLRRNRLVGNGVAVMIQCKLDANIGARLTVLADIDSTNTVEGCSGFVEVNVEVDGALPLTFHEWPLEEGTHTLTRLRGGEAELEVVGAEICVVTWEVGETRKKRNRRRREPLRLPTPRVGPGWAHEVLGTAGCEDLTPPQLRQIYRRRAREVHPDKHHCRVTADCVELTKQTVDDAGGTSVEFYQVTAAYEAVLSSLELRESRKRSLEAQPHTVTKIRRTDDRLTSVAGHMCRGNIERVRDFTGKKHCFFVRRWQRRRAPKPSRC